MRKGKEGGENEEKEGRSVGGKGVNYRPFEAASMGLLPPPVQGGLEFHGQLVPTASCTPYFV